MSHRLSIDKGIDSGILNLQITARSADIRRVSCENTHIYGRIDNRDISRTLSVTDTCHFVALGVDMNFSILDLCIDTAFDSADAGVTANGLVLTIAGTVTPDVAATLVLEAAATYPSYIAEADKAKYDAWVEKYNVTDRGSEATVNQKAYLLNVDPTDAAAVKTAEEEFKITSITVNADGSVTVTMPEGKSYNGTVEIRGCDTVNGTYSKAQVDEKTARFFKAILQ